MRKARLLLLFLPGAIAAQQVDVYRYDVRQHVRSSTMFEAAPQKPESVVIARAISGKSFSRIDYTAPAMVAGPLSHQAGDYMLTDSTGARLVSPARKTVTVLDPSRLGNLLGDMFAGMPMEVGITITDDTVRVDSLGPGGTVQGRATNRWRTYTAFRLNMTMAGESMSMSQRHTTDYWFTNDVDVLNNPAIMLSAADSVGKGPMQRVMELTMQAVRRLPRGFPMRSTTAIVIENPMGGSNEAVVTAEVINLRRDRADASLFRVPPDYKVQQLSELLKQVMDSARAGRPQ